jgi:type I restriction enzyme S subunit
MGIKKGYKQTEVGVIPEDWEVMSIGQIARIRTGPFGTLLKASEYSSEGVPVVSVGEIRHGYLRISDNTPRVSEMVTKRLPQYVLKVGDIVFGRKGGVDRSAHIRKEEDGWFLGSDGIAIRADVIHQPEFLAFQFQTTAVKNWLLQNSIGTTMPSLNQGVLSRVQIPIPSTIHEQEAIAEALSDADTLIESLEQLLAKKRHIKQGAMQKLLTGKKRLPGFSGKWDKKRLGDVADTDPESLSSSTSAEYAFNYIALEDVEMGTLRSHTEQVFRSAPSRARRKLRKDDVVVSTVRPNLKSHFIFLADNGEWVCSTGFSVLRCKDGVAHPAYVFLQMFGNFIVCQIETLLTGSNYPAINSRDVRALEIPLPRYEEQIAIATVLSDMDGEIFTLETKLTKARQLKTGMMQELLTGRIRLI